MIIVSWVSDQEDCNTSITSKGKEKASLGDFFSLSHLFLEGRKSFPKVPPWELYQQFPQGSLMEFTLSTRTMERQEKYARKLFQAEKSTWAAKGWVSILR